MSWLRLAFVVEQWVLIPWIEFDRFVSFRFFFEVINILRLPVSSGIQGNGTSRGAGFLAV